MGGPNAVCWHGVRTSIMATYHIHAKPVVGFIAIYGRTPGPEGGHDGA